MLLFPPPWDDDKGDRNRTKVNRPWLTLCNPERTALPKPALLSDSQHFTEALRLRAQMPSSKCYSSEPQTKPMRQAGQEGLVLKISRGN